jgi:hypothetical protein
LADARVEEMLALRAELLASRTKVGQFWRDLLRSTQQKWPNSDH